MRNINRIKLNIKADEFKKKLNLKDGEPGIQGPPGPIGIGKPGKPGKDAKPPTKTELKSLIKPLIPDPIPGEDGVNGSPDTPIEIRDKLETLDGNYRLDAKAIKNLPLVGVAYNERRGGTKGHTIQDEGVNLSARTNLNFVGAGVTVTDDAANDQTDVTIAADFISSVTDTASVDLTVAAGALSATVLPAGVDHGGLGGLADDDHTQYALLAGRSGGQTLIGGTASGNNLTLQSTSHATKGKILFGTSAYDEVNDRLLIGNTTGINDLHIEKNVNSAVNLYVLNPSTGVNSQVQMLFGIAGTGGQYCWVAHRGTNKTASGVLVANSSSFVGADINGTILGSINSGGGASTSFVAGGYDASNECMRIRSNGNISISGKSGSPFLSGAYLHFAPGTAAVNSAPLRFRSGTLLTTAEVGAIEFLTDKFYATITTGTARKELTLNDVALTSGRVPFATTNGRLTDDADFTFATDTLTVTKIAATTLTGLQTYADAVNMTFNATTGTKIGTATTQKLAFYNATPIVQPTGIIDADGTLADITTKFNALLAKLEALGLQAVA